MSSHISSRALDDEVSYVVPLSNYGTDGLCRDYTLRRSKWEAEANAGSHEARMDWMKYIGPIEEFGGCNPINGNFSAVALPLTRPDRLRLVAYLLEYIFMYDNMVEVANADGSDTNNQHDQRPQEWRYTDPALGKTEMQAKMMEQLTSMDPSCTGRVKRTWKETISIVSPNKGTLFGSLEEYLDFRVVDAGTSLVEALLLFGMGVTLTEEEDAILDPIRKPCFAALSLGNDYLSFDREYLEFLESEDEKTLKNAVWLHMQWDSVGVDAAKKTVLEATRKYEAQFLEDCAQFQRGSKGFSEKLKRHLDALAYQVSGNVVWSLNCPRYCPDHRYDSNAGIEDQLTAKAMPEFLGIEYKVRIAQRAKEAPGQLAVMNSGLENGRSRNSSSETSLTASDDTGSTPERSVSP